MPRPAHRRPPALALATGLALLLLLAGCGSGAATREGVREQVLQDLLAGNVADADRKATCVADGMFGGQAPWAEADRNAVTSAADGEPPNPSLVTRLQELMASCEALTEGAATTTSTEPAGAAATTTTEASPAALAAAEVTDYCDDVSAFQADASASVRETGEVSEELRAEGEVLDQRATDLLAAHDAALEDADRTALGNCQIAARTAAGL